MTDRTWDSYDAYLFDIDGTLLQCADAVHFFAFCHVLSEVAGRHLDLEGVMTQGSVDVAILRDAWTAARVAETIWRPRLAEACSGMGGHVEAHRADFKIEVMPGAAEVLTHLRARGAVLGVATGNLARIGRAKLDHCGLWPLFHFGGFSDGLESRTAVFGAALQQARELTSRDATVTVVGDTPADIEAAHANGLDVIAVATGIFEYETLAALKPTRCLRSLQELLP